MVCRDLHWINAQFNYTVKRINQVPFSLEHHLQGMDPFLPPHVSSLKDYEEVDVSDYPLVDDQGSLDEMVSTD